MKKIYFLLTLGVVCGVFATPRVFADVLGNYSIDSNGVIDIQGLSSAGGARGGGAVNLSQGVFPNGSGVAQGSQGWSAFGQSVWQHNYTDCVVVTNAEVKCDFQSHAGLVAYMYDTMVSAGAPAGDYYFSYYDSLDTLGVHYYYPFYWDGTSGGISPVSNLTTTGISYVRPVDKSVIATSTSAQFDVSGYVSSSDFQDGMYVQLEYVSAAAAVVPVGASPSLYTTTLRWNIATSGPFNFSTTSPVVGTGRYNVLTRIKTNSSAVGNILDFLGFNELNTSGVVVATSTTFVASTTSAYDTLGSQLQTSFTQYVGTTTTALSCDPFHSGASFSDCMNYLFLPHPTEIQALFNQVMGPGGFLTRVPWGYVTRFVAVVSTSATVEPPALSYTFGSSSPSTLQGMTYTVQIWDHMGSDSPLVMAQADDGSHKNIWDIVDPYFRVLVGFSILLLILSRMLDIRIQHDKTQSAGTDEYGAPEEGTLTKKEAYAAKVRSYDDGRKY